jgi:hypothetical protein
VFPIVWELEPKPELGFKIVWELEPKLELGFPIVWELEPKPEPGFPIVWELEWELLKNDLCSGKKDWNQGPTGG